MMYYMAVRFLSDEFDRRDEYSRSSNRVWFRVLLLVFTAGTVHSCKEPGMDLYSVKDIRQDSSVIGVANPSLPAPPPPTRRLSLSYAKICPTDSEPRLTDGCWQKDMLVTESMEINIGPVVADDGFSS